MATISRSFEEKLGERIRRLPREPGVYLFKDDEGRVIYVGKAKELRTRVSSYLREGADGRHQIRFLLARAVSLDYMVTANEQEALILENNLIKKHRPRYNIVFKDDKSYVNVRLDVEHPFPRFTVVRRPRRDKAKYFGPYASASAVRSTLRMLGRVFPMRTCSDSELASRKRPCLYYHLKRCPAPCVGLVDERSYRETVNKAVMFLKGRAEELVASLKERMEAEAAERKYEQAARTRDQLFALQRVLQKQRVTSPQTADRDVFGVCRDEEKLAVQVLHVRDRQLCGGSSHFFDHAALSTTEHLSSFVSQYYQSGAAVPSEIVVSEPLEDAVLLEEFLASRRDAPVRIVTPRRGEKKRLLDLAVENARAALESRGGAVRNRRDLEALKEILALERTPRRIECYDVSNLQGAEAVASRATFVDGEPAKALYRRYRIKTVEGVDDYGMLEEVLERRVARGVEEDDLPDLIVVDGGKGQMNVALKVLERWGVEGVEVAGIAKARERARGRRVRGREKIYAPRLARPHLVKEDERGPLDVLRRIRDEAHRFALAYHKRLRQKKIETSALDAIPGVGPVLKRRLLAAFGSVAGIRSAEVAELSTVQGVSEGLARRIKEGLGRQGP